MSKYQFIISIFCSLILLSCTPAVEKKVKQYNAESKTVITSSIGIETKNNYVLFSDDNGIRFDNMKEIINVLTYNKVYALCSPHMRIPCGNTGIEITPAYSVYEGDETEMLVTKEILNEYNIHMIGDWAAILTPQKHMPEYTSNLLVLPDKDTLYTISSLVRIKTYYNMSYSNEMEYISIINEEKSQESDLHVKLFGDLLYSDVIDGDVNCQSPIDKYIEDKEIRDWLHGEDMQQLIYVAECTLTKDHFFAACEIGEISFENSWINKTFKVSEMGSPAMLDTISVKIVEEYVRYQNELEERERQEYIENVKKYSVAFRDVFNMYRDNPVKAKKLYPAGKRMIIAMELGGIKETPFARSKYSLDPDLISFAGDVSITTDDEKFAELDYPHYVWMNVYFYDYSESWTGTFSMKFRDAQLLMW